MTHQTLEQKLKASGGAARMARNAQLGPNRYPFVPAEFSNWRDEQTSWRDTVALFDLTHHMSDLSVSGPDAIRLFSDLGVNSFKGFTPGRAKQFVCCNSNGYIVGDGILFFLEKDNISLLGLPAAHNWVQYHALLGRYDVAIERDEPTAVNPAGKRRLYRFQVQGPNAIKLLERATGGPLPEIKFFNLGEFSIKGHRVRALRHGMSSAPGLEVFGPWDEMNEIKAAILDAGAELGLREVGFKAYVSTALESGWIPGPVPAIFTESELRPYREWLSATAYEGICSLGGSYNSEDISDFYVTPQELGYWPLVKFDHPFTGRQAMEAMGGLPKRRRVTLAWNADDITAAMRTLFTDRIPVKFIDLPMSTYSTWHYDKVLQNGKIVGLSTHTGYSANERRMLSLAILDSSIPLGAEVAVVWGEEGGPSKPTVERHVQSQIRAVVSPCPYSVVARTSYADGWRTKAATT